MNKHLITLKDEVIENKFMLDSNKLSEGAGLVITDDINSEYEGNYILV